MKRRILHALARYAAVVLDGMLRTSPPVGWRFPDPAAGGVAATPQASPARCGSTSSSASVRADVDEAHT